MKHICSSIFLFVSLVSYVFAYNYETEVLEYTRKNKLLPTTVVLNDLESQTSFDGKYFKIVMGKSDEAVQFSDEDNAMRAAHVYYHLSRARQYFVSLPGANLEHLNKKTTIRLDLTNVFDPFAKFAHDEFQPDYNTAVTIPPSDDQRLETIPPWHSEIWFRPMKIIRNADATNRIAAALDDTQVRRNLQVTVLEYQLNQMLFEGITTATLGNLFNDNTLLTVGVGLLAIEFMPAIIRLSGKLFKTSFYIDTAMIPEIIYHEYSHLALSDHIDLHSTPVIEGYANYFAGQISGKGHWGNGPAMYSLDQGRNAFAKDLYSFSVESNLFATSSFVFKTLWGLKKLFHERGTDHLLYASRTAIDRDSDIKHDMIDALFDHLKIINKDDLLHRMKLHDHLQRMGI